MNRTSTDKIRSATPFLIWFRQTLSPQVQVETRRYLDQPYQLALNILDCCSESQPIAVKEIALMVGVTRETVRQVLQALREGGMAFLVSPLQGWQYLDRSSIPADQAATLTEPTQIDRWATSGWTELAAAPMPAPMPAPMAAPMALMRSTESAPRELMRSTPKEASVSPSVPLLVACAEAPHTPN